MPEWCPKCNAMLPPGSRKCPVCGAKLPSSPGDQTSNKEIFWFSAYIIGLALIPLLIALGIGILCILFFR